MSESLKDLIKKRGSVKGRLTLFMNYVNSLADLEQVQCTELELRIKKAEQLLTQFDLIQSNIEYLADTDDDLSVFTERQEIEDQFYSYISKAKQIYKSSLRKINNREDDNDDIHSCISGSSQSSGEVKQTKASVRLPTIQIPKFSGRYEDWLEFRDTFISLIHENITISEIQKFHYLRASLEGGAAQVIRSINFSSANYTIAWNLLCDRYNNDKLLIHNHVQSLFKVEPIKRESSVSIRTIIDTFSKNLRSLDSLGEPTSRWDTLIIYLINSKLDSKTSRDWEEHKTTLNKVTLTDLITFLKNKADLLETIQSNNNNSTDNHKIKTHHLKGLLNTNTNTNSTYTPKCPLCKKQHKIYYCEIFLNKSVSERAESARNLKLCPNCLRGGHRVAQCRSYPCPRCLTIKHNKLLCDSSNEAQESSSTQARNVEPPVDKATTLSVQMTEPVLLSTAVVYIQGSDNQRHQARAVLDSGSQASFVTDRLLNKLGLACYNTETSITGINCTTVTKVTKRCDTIISSKVNSFKLKVSLYVLPDITNLGNNRALINHLHINSKISLADPEYYNPTNVDLLLGADVFWDLILTDQIRLGKNCPILQQTQLGYIISGPTSGLKQNKINKELISCNFLLSECSEIQDQLTKFWSLEETPYESKPAYSLEESSCEKHFIENVKRMPDGRFSVAIPLKQPESLLGDSYNRALQCFLSLERRLQKQPKLKQMYTEFMNEYMQLGHMSLVPRDTDTKHTNYLPHHGVLREQSSTTKLRTVFNASAATTTGISFNNLQMVGPTIQSDLFSILIRFRHFTYVLTADIEKMYRQVLVHANQRHLQQILWRDDPNNELQTYQLNTVTYGTASAPFLAVRCLKQLANECEDSFISEIISNDFYVDDLVTGSQSVDSLLKLKDDVYKILSQGCFNLRKFKSNIQNFETQSSEKCTSLNLGEENSSTLGLGWTPSTDTLCYSNEPPMVSQPTKRSVLSTIGQIFDPLGLLTVFVIQAKIILQKLWLEKVSWDEPLPTDIALKWNKFTSDLQFLKNLDLPRCSTCPNPDIIEIHTFCDASQDAYGACIYLKSVSASNQIETRLLCAKSKVAPLKPVTIPRLELCGAVVAARLTQKVCKAFRLPVRRCVLWSDSAVVLGWLKTSPSKLKVFVKNRVAEIQELTQTFEWRHVSTRDNPADLLTRGVDMSSIHTLDLWWSGPKFLRESESQWPKTKITNNENLPEVVVHLTSSSPAPENKQIIDINRFSKLSRLKRALAYALRFVKNCKIHIPDHKLSGPLSTDELQNAFNMLLKQSQIESFPEYTILQNKKHLPNKNSLLQLSPFLDEDGLIRVGGRLKNSNFNYDQKHPVLLSSKHYLSKLIFLHEHIQLFHAAPQLLLSSIRQQFWPLGGRNLARQIAHKCQRCFRAKAQNINPIMGQLPEQRVNPGYPFETTGVDYCGPLLAADRKGRGCRLIKVYVAVFVCFTTKAIHLELVTDLTKDAYIAALRRFIARRSKPRTLFSDQGTQFIGAKNEIYSFLKQQQSNLVEQMANDGITFKFIPAYTPHFGGLWESSVRSIKYHLIRILGNARLTFEELYTTLTQIEAILNSRPLYPMSPDPNDLHPLTPGHFLVGRPLMAIAAPKINSDNISRLQRWDRIEKLRQNFWERWRKEYVAELQQKTKWRSSKGSLRVGDLVLIKDDALPPMKWSLGRILRVYEGVDGVGRVADVRTTRGSLRRAFNRICPLPRESVETPGFNVGGHVKDKDKCGAGRGECAASQARRAF